MCTSCFHQSAFENGSVDLAAIAGLASGSDQHDGLRQALQPGQQAEASSAVLCGKQWQDFQEATRDELGQVKRLGMAGRSATFSQSFEAWVDVSAAPFFVSCFCIALHCSGLHCIVL